MTAPIGTDVGEISPAMGNAMVDLGFVRIGLCIRLRNALCDNLFVTLAMAGELAVGALHAGSILEQFSAESATHDIVELLLDELVAILLVDFFLLLADGTLTTQAQIKWLLVSILLD